ncbi:MAG: septum formation initiator family protein [Terracoccus sp.]
MADRTPSREGRSPASRPAAGPRPPARKAAAGTPRSAPRAGANGTARTGAPPPASGPAAGGSQGKTTGRSTDRSTGTRAGSSRTGPARAGKAGPGRTGPGKARPALAARPRTAQPLPPSPSTAWVRGAILFGIVVMLAVTLVPTLRSVLAQRGDTAALSQSIVAQRDTVSSLERQAALWKDPDFIEVQARERLKFVRIGDRAYTVVDPTRDAAKQAAAPAPVVSAPLANDHSPWYGKLWQSVQIADSPAAGLPATKG